jgi:hypothetical protein
MQTIKTKDGKQSYHGTILKWFNSEEFLFIPSIGGSFLNPWWCKTDYWDVIDGIKFGSIVVK